MELSRSQNYRGGRCVDINRIPVSSSDLRSVGYNPESQTLEIEFRSGGVYRYSGVPESVYRSLMAASSHGKYFHEHIKDNYIAMRIRNVSL